MSRGAKSEARNRLAGSKAPGSKAPGSARRGSVRHGASVGVLWARGFAVAFVLCLVAFAINLWVGEVSPGNVWGLVYGSLAAVLMLAAGLYGMRRRAMSLASKYRLGKARTWLYVHIYGGALFLLLVLMHSGFRIPSGVVTWWLWLLSIWTVASGLFGLALQQWIPRALGSGLALEVLYERIPELVDEIREKAVALVATSASPVQDIFARRVEPSLQAPARRFIYFVDITGGKQAQLREFDYVRGFLPGEEKAKLGQLARLYKAKLDLDAQYTLQWALRTWLWLHLPTSLVLFILLILHLFAVFYY